MSSETLALRLVEALKLAPDAMRDRAQGAAEDLFGAVRVARSLELDPIDVIKGALVRFAMREMRGDEQTTNLRIRYASEAAAARLRSAVNDVASALEAEAGRQYAQAERVLSERKVP